MSRKLGISPGEILRYLSEQNMPVAEGSNIKLDEVRIRALYARFAPEIADFPDPRKEDGEAVQQGGAADLQVELERQESPSRESELPPVPSAESSFQEQANVNVDTIRASKVELAGLKVLGKIELPAPRKKDTDVAAAPPTETREATPGDMAAKGADEVKPDQAGKAGSRHERGRREGPRKSDPRRSRENREKSNPIAAQREREKAEEMERRKVKAAEEKERRTRAYNNRVKHSPPTKPVRLIEEPLEHLEDSADRDRPVTWLGKFLRWLGIGR